MDKLNLTLVQVSSAFKLLCMYVCVDIRSSAVLRRMYSDVRMYCKFPIFGAEPNRIWLCFIFDEKYVSFHDSVIYKL